MKKLVSLFSSVVLLGSVASYGSGRLAFTDKDHVMRRDSRRAVTNSNDTSVSLWRGERGGIAAVYRPDRPTGRLKVRLEGNGVELPAGFKPYFADYVLTNSYRKCGWPADSLPVYEVADALVRDSSAELQAGAQRFIWVTLDVPRDAEPGIYPMRLIVDDLYGVVPSDTLGITARIGVNSLPDPRNQKFHLNMWQQPYAISRYYGLEPWSKEHFEALRPYARMLARAGQKMVSTILIYEPWGVQSYDKFEPMVETRLKADGKWTHDFSVFDAYVEFMAENGVDGGIECYSMIPWDLNFRYFDEAKGKYETLHAAVGSDDYIRFWHPFLKNLENHLKEKGWLDKTLIAIDERQLPAMLSAYGIVKEAAPGLEMALAGNWHPELSDKLPSYTLLVGQDFPAEALAQRNAKGWTSSLYTCCADEEPNIFSNSEPADAAFIPAHCLSKDVSGYLHWAFSNWTENPSYDSRFYMFAPGDTYCVYPEGGSSVRWERMIEGIGLTEKVRILREKLKKEKEKKKLAELEGTLEALRESRMPLEERIDAYNALTDLVESLSE